MSDRPAFSCRQVVDLVTEYLEGELPTEERLAFERHVAICPPCRGYFGQLRRIRGVAGELREDAIPAELRTHVLDSFRSWRDEAPGS